MRAIRPAGLKRQTTSQAGGGFVLRSARDGVVLLLLAGLALAAPCGGRAQQPARAANVHSVFVAPVAERKTEAGFMPQELRARVLERLGHSNAVMVAKDEASANAVLRINAVIWQTGTVTLNPRSHSGSLINYQGYASAYLYAGSGAPGGSPQILWTYLATPKRFRFDGIVDDLSDQIATNLIRAVDKGIPTSGSSAAGGGLRVAGATFPAPLYLKWFQSFGEQPGGVPMTYDAVGSVAGSEELAAGKVDMAASDLPRDAAPEGVLRLPSVVGGIVPIYNLADRASNAVEPIDVTPELLADIYAGKITFWDDPRMVAVNRGYRLPHAAIAVVHRSDGSGTTYAWTSYLAQASGDWKNRVGATIDWLAGVGVEGNEGVAEEVAKTPNSIGYVELTYAIQHRLRFAAVRNPAGRYIKADLDSIGAAAASSNSMPGASILNSPAKDAYPIATFTWLIVPREIADPQRRASLHAFLHWMLTTGQKECSALGYAPLPRELANRELREADSLK